MTTSHIAKVIISATRFLKTSYQNSTRTLKMKWYLCTLVPIVSAVTLYFYNNNPSKNKHFLILLSSLARNSQEPKLKRTFEIPWVLFEKSLSLYFDWPKSWIWLTLEKVMKFFVNGTFEPMRQIQNFLLPKDFFWGIMKVYSFVVY